MPSRRSSERLARDLYENLLKTAREEARAGTDITPGSPQFYRFCGTYLAEVGEILQLISEEVADEAEALINGDTRACVVCGGRIIKRHKKGRWPIYCDSCSVRDRV